MQNDKSKFKTSLKSANESKLWLALLRDSNRVKSEDVEWFLDELNEISNIFASSLLTLKGRK
jgi:four helix bundle protein